jgi:hypothetical protein
MRLPLQRMLHRSSFHPAKDFYAPASPPMSSFPTWRATQRTQTLGCRWTRHFRRYLREPERCWSGAQVRLFRWTFGRWIGKRTPMGRKADWIPAGKPTAANARGDVCEPSAKLAATTNQNFGFIWRRLDWLPPIQFHGGFLLPRYRQMRGQAAVDHGAVAPVVMVDAGPPWGVVRRPRASAAPPPSTRGMLLRRQAAER